MKKILLSMMALAIGFASIAQEQEKEHKGRGKGHNKEWKKEKKEKKEKDKEWKEGRDDDRDEKEFKEFKGRGHAYGRIAQELNLSEAQKQQAKTINESFRSKMQALKEDKSLSEEAKRERRRQLAEEHKAQLLAILTPEQRKQVEEKRAQGGYIREKRFDKEQKKSEKAARRS